MSQVPVIVSSTYVSVVPQNFARKKLPIVNNIIDGVNLASFVKHKFQKYLETRFYKFGMNGFKNDRKYDRYDLFTYTKDDILFVQSKLTKIIQKYHDDYLDVADEVHVHIVFKDFCRVNVMFREMFLNLLNKLSMNVTLYWTSACSQNGLDKQCDDRLVVKLAAFFDNSVIISNDKYSTAVDDLEFVNECIVYTIDAQVSASSKWVATPCTLPKLSDICNFETRSIERITTSKCWFDERNNVTFDRLYGSLHFDIYQTDRSDEQSRFCKITSVY